MGRRRIDHPPAIVFLGPSLPVREAEAILAATYRPPIRRGDLEAIEPGAVVGIIDGVFDQALAVSPREVREALLRGVRILGGSSMGALRAVEVPGVEGVGRVYQMFRDGLLEDDDEVALVFDAETQRPLSEPMVNVRHAVERLVRPGTIDPAVGARIVAAAKRLHYPERVYPRILRDAGIPAGPAAAHLAAMLRTHDLKREDAILLLEEISRAPCAARASCARARCSDRRRRGALCEGPHRRRRARVLLGVRRARPVPRPPALPEAHGPVRGPRAQCARALPAPGQHARSPRRDRKSVV